MRKEGKSRFSCVTAGVRELLSLSASEWRKFSACEVPLDDYVNGGGFGG